MMPFFDKYLVADWNSADSIGPTTASPNQVYLAVCEHGIPTKIEYFRTRHSAEARIVDILVECAEDARKVLVGLDFAFGYPAGFARLLGHGGTNNPWDHTCKRIAQEITDNPDNSNNRFAVAANLNKIVDHTPGPFWGYVGNSCPPHLTPNRSFSFPLAGIEEFRITEQFVRAQGTSAHSVWKIAYAGSVGGQALVGIPALQRMRYEKHLQLHSTVWPFETNFGVPFKRDKDIPFIVYAEVYPSIIETLQHQSIFPGVPDADQVHTLAEWLRDEDASGRLSDWLYGPRRPGLTFTQAQIRQCELEEGWILGV